MRKPTLLRVLPILVAVTAIGCGAEPAPKPEVTEDHILQRHEEALERANEAAAAIEAAAKRKKELADQAAGK